MNNARRRKICNLLERLNVLKEELGDILDEEQEAFDNIPENLCGSERYETAEEALSNLSDAFETFDEVTEMLCEITN